MMAGCNVAESRITPHNNLTDFGDPNVKQLITRLNAIEQYSNQVVTITQFGDSHTAADFFTGEFRQLMQKRYGNAGIGWITPIFVRGQYSTAVRWKNINWDLISSRTKNSIDYPMGGFIAKSTKVNASIQITPNVVDNRLWQAKLIVKTASNSTNPLAIFDANGNQANIDYHPNSSSWQQLSATVKMPLTIRSAKDVELGDIWLTRVNQPGVVVSAIGTNGVKQSIWQKWGDDWSKELAATQSDLVILEYGTNESFDKTLNLDEYRQNLVNNIRLVRSVLPKAVILLITPPDTMVNREDIPPTFKAIKEIQKQVAKSEMTLLWDWQKAMGGNFAIKQWLLEGLARTDLIHQTPQGYKESAKMFYSDLMDFIEKYR